MISMCPMCEELREVTTESRAEDITVKGITVSAVGYYSVCTDCGEEFATGEQMEQTLKNAYDTYREQENIVTPEMIVSIRENYNVSQKTFAKILGLGELTINSYEQGQIPTKVNSNIIRLVQRVEDFKLLYESCRSKLSERQTKKIDKRLIELESRVTSRRIFRYIGHRPNLSKPQTLSKQGKERKTSNSKTAVV